MAIDFYRGFSANNVRHGLVVPHGAWGPGGNSRSFPVNTIVGGSIGSQYVFNNMRAYKFPGLVRLEKGARGSIPCPDPAVITDNSTITLTDGNDTVIYEFDKDGSGLTVGDTLVDIQAAVTPLDVAQAFAAAIVADNPANILMGAYALDIEGVAKVALIQRVHGVPGWMNVPAGQYGDVTLPVVASIPVEWPGIPAALAGGRPTTPGLFYAPFFSGAAIRVGARADFYKGTTVLEV